MEVIHICSSNLYKSSYIYIDEVTSLVFDLGTFNCRIGYSGEDNPYCVFRPVIGIDGETYFYNDKLQYHSPDMKLLTYMDKNGTIEDYNLFENMLNNLLDEQFKVNIQDYPILFTEPSLHNKEHRKKLTNFMFEKYNIPAMFICKNAVLSAFSCGRSTCLVFDSGHYNTCAVPVHDGYALQKCLIKSEIAGDYITKLVRKKIESQNIKINPFYKIKKRRKEDHFITEILSNVSAQPVYEDYWKDEIYREIKEICLIASEEAIPYNEENDTFTATSMNHVISYDLPDGNTIELAEDRMFLVERVFNSVKSLPGFFGYHQMIDDAISKASVDIKRDLYGNIFVCGGNTLFGNFPDRLQKQLQEINKITKLKIITHPSITERKFSTWIGGSILSSLGSFHQFWLSKQEYEEHGDMIIERKCA